MFVAILLFSILGLLVWIGALLGQCEHLERRLQSQETYVESLEDKALKLETTLYKLTFHQRHASPPAETRQFPAMSVVAETEMTL